MRDIRVVTAKTLLKVSSLSPVRNFYPPSVIALGERFNFADEILYNNVQVTEFIIISPTRLLIRIPISEVGRGLTDLQVLASAPISQRDATVALGITRPITTISGIDRLVQEWLLVFLTNPGSDIFDLTGGGGAFSVIRRPVYGAGSNAIAELSLSVETAKQQLLAKQATNSRIPPEERLLTTTLSNVRFDSQSTTLTALVDIKNIVGESASVSIR